MDVSIALAVLDLPTDHSAVRSAGAEFDQFARDIPELAGLLRRDGAAAPGVKGPWSDLLVSLTGPAAVAGFVRLANLWLHRDKRRSLTLTDETVVDGKVQTRTVTLSGENLSEETVRQAVEQFREDQE
ncbi:effector-associated constant component EACC1 [Paractinoplanes durhamensis]|uniref:Uncharacterized protein n=1 Tax=Paractinoplanes durhamensis TaxID=113563 RepID=A0ABQ3YSV2_9ACTN|nr:hypothetical protein [Actinoplanes durhamensis]GIE00595.1 hypothetical protein Adu01nite_19450 [Actinoplanes durhamensis]